PVERRLVILVVRLDGRRGCRLLVVLLVVSLRERRHRQGYDRRRDYEESHLRPRLRTASPTRPYDRTQIFGQRLGVMSTSGLGLQSGRGAGILRRTRLEPIDPQ